MCFLKISLYRYFSKLFLCRLLHLEINSLLLAYDFFDSMIFVFFLIISENYSDDFEDAAEDIDAPLMTKEETNSKENAKSEKTHVPKQVIHQLYI